MPTPSDYQPRLELQTLFGIAALIIGVGGVDSERRVL